MHVDFSENKIRLTLFNIEAPGYRAYVKNHFDEIAMSCVEDAAYYCLEWRVQMKCSAGN